MRGIKFLLVSVVIVALAFAVMVPMAQAAANYSVNVVPNVRANAWYVDQSPPVGSFSTIVADIPAGDLIPGNNYSFLLKLPAGYSAAANAEVPIDVDGMANGISSVALNPRGTTLVSPMGVNTFKEYEVIITCSPDNSKKGRFFIRLSSLYVPPAVIGDVNLVVEAPQGTPFPSAQLVIARAVTPQVNVSIEEIRTVNDAGGILADLRLEENVPGALQMPPGSVSLKLPAGFFWNTNNASPVMVYGDPVTMPMLNLSDLGRTLRIDCPQLSQMSTCIRITGLGIHIDQSLAAQGDVICQVSGTSNVNISSLAVANYYQPTPGLNGSIGSPGGKTVVAGKTDQRIAPINIEEFNPGGLTVGGSITLSLPQGLAWFTPPIVDFEQSQLNGLMLSPWFFASPAQDVIRCIVHTPSTSPAKIVLKNASVVASPCYKGDVIATAGGSAGVSGQAVVAVAVPPVEMQIEGYPQNIMAGMQGQSLPPILIRETTAGAIRPGADPLAGPVGGGEFRLIFPSGIVPSIPKINVVQGDLVIKPNSITRSVTNDGRWSVLFTVMLDSSVPSTIRISDLLVTTYKDIPYGPLWLHASGNSIISTYMIFPADTWVTKVEAGTVIGTAGPPETLPLIQGTVSVKGLQDRAGIKVTLYDQQNNVVGQTITDAQGQYRFSAISPGTYSVAAQRLDCKGTRADGLFVAGGEATTVAPLSLAFGDANNDGRIDLFDLVIMARNYGQ